jgi:hypothetical protein
MLERNKKFERLKYSAERKIPRRGMARAKPL